MPPLLRLALLLSTVALFTVDSALAARPAQRAAGPTLNASVGPGFVISLTDANGGTVTSLPPGQYEIVVNDQSSFHNFHLSGPGVELSTAVGDTGRVTWDVTLQPGTYNFRCDPHSGDMRGSFQVTGTPATTSTTTRPTTTTSPAPAPPAVKALAGRVGPGFTITLASAGKRITSVKAGRYAIAIADRAVIHNFVLEKSGGASERSITTVRFVGTKRTIVTLTKGKWEYYCAPHESSMHGSFLVR